MSITSTYWSRFQIQPMQVIFGWMLLKKVFYAQEKGALYKCSTQCSTQLFEIAIVVFSQEYITERVCNSHMVSVPPIWIA